MQQLFKQTVSSHHVKCLALAANYIDPSVALSSQSLPKQPLIFQKDLSCLLHRPQGLVPLQTSAQVNHEVELGILINKKGKALSLEESLEMVGAYFLALDFTCSSIREYRSKGWSFCIPKNRDNYLVVSDCIDRSSLGEHSLDQLQVSLEVNGKQVQKGGQPEMVFSVAQQIQYISQHMTLHPGDLLLTGSPAGIGPLSSQDQLLARLCLDNACLTEMSFGVQVDQIRDGLP